MKNKHYQPVWIGFVSEKDLMFQSIYTIYRQKINPTLMFQGELYKCVNSEWGCYIREKEYDQLFKPELTIREDSKELKQY